MMKAIKKILSVLLTAMMFAAAINTVCASTIVLSQGSKGTEVKRLQMNLNGIAYNVHTVDGIYGTDTVNAVKRFQASNGLKADGIAGKRTLGEIETIIKGIQEDLNDLGYSVGKVDGVYGKGTINAVKNFQRANGLTVDGVAGANTRRKIKSVKSNNQTNASNSDAIITSGYKNTASNILTYSKKVSGDVSLSKSFKVKEFSSADGTDKVLVDAKLVALLQDIRNYFGKPVIINSAYRSYTHNKNQGGGANSLHLYGMAADIKIDGIAPKEIAKYAESLGVKGIGLYNTFVHVDTRTSKYYWKNYGSNSVVSSFK